MLDPAQLSALSAVLRTGSFDRAARALNITQSAVSQRIRALEDRVGTILIRRGQPATATEAGARLARHAEALALIEADLRADLGLAGAATPTVSIAVNADSLATWFLPALSDVGDLLFDLVVDDQDHSQDLLRGGEVAAALTGHPGPAQGCDSHSLGALRYLATANPAFRDRWFAKGLTAGSFAAAPSLTFNAKDALQDTWVQIVTGQQVTRPSHVIPSSQGFVDAVLLGMGWSMNPESLVAAHIAAGRLVPLAAGRPLDVALYWQVSRLTAKPLAALTRSVRSAAATALVRP